MQQEIPYLLDKNTPFDRNKVAILDKVVHSLYSLNSTYISQNDANQVLQNLKENNDFWMKSDIVLENSDNVQTKQITLLILEGSIKSKWKILNQQQQQGIRNYIMNMIITLSKQQTKTIEQNNLLNGGNSIIVEVDLQIQIVKQEWMTTWRDFIPQICQASLSDQNLCENSLQILKLLSEEVDYLLQVFDHSKNNLTSKQVQELKAKFATDFTQIFDLCYSVCKFFVESNGQLKQSLMKSCLETLHAFLTWIPLHYIFQNDILDTVFIPLIKNQSFCIITIKCLTEVINNIQVMNIKIDSVDNEQNIFLRNKMLVLFQNAIREFNQIIPYNYDLQIEMQNLLKYDKRKLQKFEDICLNSSLLFTSFLTTHNEWIENLVDNYLNDQYQMMNSIQQALSYIIQFTKLHNDIIFKICIEFWNQFASNILRNNELKQLNNINIMNQSHPQLSTTIYPQILNQVRQIMVTRMAKPEEVLITTDENGNAIKQTFENTENNCQFEIMRDLMISLSRLNWENTKLVIEQRMMSIMDGSEFTFDNLNTLCWAAGSISGSLPDAEERTFFVRTLKDLLTLVDTSQGKESKATIAANIMYLVGQFPKFMQQNASFLQTVCKKLFEFMNETFPGVMNMAVNTFLKISDRCKNEFVNISQTVRDNTPYIHEILRNYSEYIQNLDEKDILVFFEAIGNIISAEGNSNVAEQYINKCLSIQTEIFQQIICQAYNQSNEILQDDIVITKILKFLKINERLAFSIKTHYISYYNFIFQDLVKLYNYYSLRIQQEVNNQGLIILNHYFMKKMRNVKRCILSLMVHTIQNTQPEHHLGYVQHYINILQDYEINIIQIREPEVITLFAIIIEKLNVLLQDQIELIFKLLFNSTLPMITSDFNSFPDHRLNFFGFLKAVINNAFTILFSCPQAQFQTMFDCVIWAIKHDLPNIFDIGLDIMLKILQNLNTNQQIANPFYQTYYLYLLFDIIFVLTDSFHKNGFKIQSQILQILFQVLDEQFLLVPLVQGQTTTNQQYIYEQISDSLSKRFQNISKSDTQNYIQLIMQSCKNEKEFRTNLRDYLIQLDHFSNEDLFDQKTK